jgi:hypothetical protein
MQAYNRASLARKAERASPDRKGSNMRFHIAATAVAAGVLLGGGAAIAQNAPQAGPYDQPSPQGYYQQMPPQQMPTQRSARHERHGAMQIIKEEMRSGRLSEKEGTLIAQKLKQNHAERRAERHARSSGEGASPPQQMQPPR